MGGPQGLRMRVPFESLLRRPHNIPHGLHFMVQDCGCRIQGWGLGFKV